MKKVSKYTIAAVLLSFSIVVAIVTFAIINRIRITQNNRIYLKDNTTLVAGLIGDAITAGYDNIKILSKLVEESLTKPEFDIRNMQRYINNSVFDFMEYADKYGIDHNITGGISDASDRPYFIDAKAGNTGLTYIYNSRATHETLLTFYSPIMYEGEFAGALIGIYQASNRITKLLKSEYLEEPATSYLLTPQGRVLACSMGFDPTKEMYITELAGDDQRLKNNLQASLNREDATIFTLPGNKTGVCVAKVPGHNFFVVQIFPQAAGARMISEAGGLGFSLALFIIIVFSICIYLEMKIFREQQRQIRRAKEEAEEANRAKSIFLFNMSHDIRTPMNAILGFAGLIKKRLNDRELLGYHEKIEQSGQLLLSIINNVLDMARIESGKMELDENISENGKIISEVIDIFETDASKRNIWLKQELEIINPYIICDRTKIKEIFLNLVSNSIKYTMPGGTVTLRTVELSSEREGYTLLKTTVTDTGIGISPDYLPHIFESFTRERTSASHKAQGTGLGMAIVKRLVDLMNGRIEVESELGAGTTITVYLELKIAERNAKSEIVENSPIEGWLELLKGKRILLAEDNDLNAEIATIILEEAGLIVEHVADGVQCVSRIDEQPVGTYDAILMDIQMPNMDGYMATKAIRGHKESAKASIPIVAMTANVFDEDRKRAFDAGMNGRLAKPIDINQIIATLIGLIKKGPFIEEEAF